MYKIISVFNAFIRQNILQNPFELISCNLILILIFVDVVGPKIIYKISFSMCGVFYNKGDNPILGSIVYMIFYIVNIGIILELSKISNNIMFVSLGYISAVIIIFIVLNKIKNTRYRI